MNKKVYESPVVEVYMMEASMMIAASPGNGDGTDPVGGGSTTIPGEGEGSEYAPGHRGEWGQIWN